MGTCFSSTPELEVTDKQPLKALEWFRSVESVVPECANAMDARHGKQPRRENALSLHLLSFGVTFLGVAGK